MRILLWIASFAGLALLARSLLLQPPPTWLAVASLFAYTALSISGWIFPEWQMYGDVFCRARTPHSVVALSFDDGPNPLTTPSVLDVLAQFGCVATFCVIGEKAERHSALVQRIAREGHLLVPHGYRHERLYAWRSPGYIARDIRRCVELITRLTGQQPTWFRPPIGHVSPRVVAGARRASARLLGFSARSLDGIQGATPPRVLRRLIKATKPGAIIALHDSAERDDFTPAGVEVLPELLRHLVSEGLQVVSIDQLLDQHDADDA